MLNDLDDASARVNALAPKSAFNVTAGPPQKTGVNRRTGYCWYEMAGEWSRLEGDLCRTDGNGRIVP